MARFLYLLFHEWYPEIEFWCPVCRIQFARVRRIVKGLEVSL